MIFEANLLFDGGYNATTGLQGLPVLSPRASTNIIDQLFARDLAQAKSGPASLGVMLLVTTTFSGAVSLNVQLQGSTDNVTWTTYSETGPIPEASLVAGAKFTFGMPVVLPESGAPPRYYQLYYVVAGANLAGSLIAALASIDDAHSYRAGVVVAN